MTIISTGHLFVKIQTTLSPGDIGEIIRLHGVLYAREYGWDETFEVYVAEGLSKFVLNYNPERDRIWVAEHEGRIVGCIAIAGYSETEAQLRWYLVHPEMRGRGLGKRLISEAVQFCRERDYRSIFLWTTSDLKAAAYVYQSIGFHKTEEKTHEIWGKIITEERWDMML